VQLQQRRSYPQGQVRDVDLAGLKFWLSGDLGADWATKGQADWLVATFEPKATKEQKDAVMAVLGKIYPVKCQHHVKREPFSSAQREPVVKASSAGTR